MAGDGMVLKYMSEASAALTNMAESSMVDEYS
jgi:hypothetical protein